MTGKIHIISVGKLSAEFAKIAEKYEKMIRWQLKCSEISYSQKLPPNQVKPFEAKLITDCLTNGAYKIALDRNGALLDSFRFSELINKALTDNARGVEFIIGGASGIDAQIIKAVTISISLSPMTFPHQMAKIILLEQIYRCQAILANHPYHK